MEKRRFRAAVVVLGDIGRSPRMQYHALSLAQSANLEVDIVANGGLRKFLEGWQMVHYVLQKRCSMNLLRIGESRQQFYMTSLQNFFILLHLKKSMRLETNILHPNGIWDCVSTGRKDQDNGVVVPSNHSLFTAQSDSEIFLKANRPALVVSSTSWTPDEDFSYLLEAAVMYDRRVAAALNEDDSVDEKKLWIDIHNGKQCLYPRLLFIITGKGPERRKYEEQIKKLNLRRVAFRTMWLSAEDYPLLLGSADLGVCLHTSSSGLDLPMKVVDMFGCGLPVCAVAFSCIEELVKVDKNGLLFSSSSELADEFMMLFKGFPGSCDTLQTLKEGAIETGASAKWSSEWETHALPLIREGILRKNR